MSAKRLDLYHECRNCTIGKNVESYDVRDGIPPRARLCDECSKLSKENRCQPGKPIPVH